MSLRLVSQVLLTGSSALLFGLAFPPMSWRTLAWIALVPLFVVLRLATLRGAILLTCLWCLLTGYVVGDWLPKAVSTYFQQPRLVGAAFFLGVISLMAIPYYVSFAVVYRVLARRFRVALPFLAAAAWVTVELGRGRLFRKWPPRGYMNNCSYVHVFTRSAVVPLGATPRASSSSRPPPGTSFQDNTHQRPPDAVRPLSYPSRAPRIASRAAWRGQAAGVADGRKVVPRVHHARPHCKVGHLGHVVNRRRD